ncbi:LOW QUALITY PROTEIN: odorant-binding protein 2b-like [Tamandua tetradactyla]|uniref:LOW QUALITY PROTEIN: odorant-binding protein 2b-like n=1 Tax=Tamandua tetradactyla TaxID=48850 RepID=UPI004053E7FB
MCGLNGAGGLGRGEGGSGEGPADRSGIPALRSRRPPHSRGWLFCVGTGWVGQDRLQGPQAIPGPLREDPTHTDQAGAGTWPPERWGVPVAVRPMCPGTRWGELGLCPHGYAGAYALGPLQITGTWYVMAIVDGKGMPVERRPKKVSPVTVTTLRGGDLDVTFTFMKKDVCHKGEFVMEKTEEPHQYTMFGGKKLVTIEELPVKDHQVIYCESQDSKKKFRLGKLISRNLDMNLEALEEFKKSIQRRGFLLENIFTPVQTENCTPESE